MPGGEISLLALGERGLNDTAKSYAQIKAIENANKERIKKLCPTATEHAGIYILTRFEDGFKYAYIGQAKHLLTRLAQHLSGYQHIDLSIKKHKLWSKDNPTGWRISCFECGEKELDSLERFYIKQYANDGFQLRNKTAGGQGEGKQGIADNKPPKGYYDGLRQGYRNAQKEVAHLFDKHLDYKCKGDKPNKNHEKAAAKFAEFLNCEGGDN